MLDRSFSGLGFVSIFLMSVSLVVILAPIFVKGCGAFWFTATIEHRRLMLELFNAGNSEKAAAGIAAANEAREPLYAMVAEFEKELKGMPFERRSLYRSSFREVKESLRELLGPLPGEPSPVLLRYRYGETRWDGSLRKLEMLIHREDWDYSDPTAMGKRVLFPREEEFEGTSLAPLFGYAENNIRRLLRPERTFYWRFFTQASHDAHFFGGIWPEILGTLYLTLGAMLFAVPLGVIAAIYLTEYAREGKLVSFLRICISTLAGVPSIVFGLFGLAFFINGIHVSGSKSVLAGSMTLALLILPTIIRASEEAIRAVPPTYKEAALSLGAGSWHTVLTVVLPAALPGILTGIVISMGRAAGETAPIIFTAAVSVGRPLTLLQTLSEPTTALPWNIYNLCTEHEAVDEIRHVQYGMVLALVGLVLLLNLTAVLLRARISRRLKG